MSILKKTMNLSKPEKPFIGFAIDDKLLKVFEYKKKLLKIVISEKTGEPIERDNLSDCPPSVNNNHVNKKKQSISKISSSKPKNFNNNLRKKKQKKDNLCSDPIKSLELHVPNTLKLDTPTFNITSSNTRQRSNAVRKINDDIYKLPFEYGWKRELVYRTSGESTILNRTNINGDVYYYSPNNRKLGSLHDIHEQLNTSSDKTSLTIESFTFSIQPIGIDDQSKELIRDANSKLSKRDPVVGIVVRHKTSVQRPLCDYELSDDENNMSSSEMEKVLKNAKSSSKLIFDKGNSESMTTISSSTPENISEDCLTNQSSVSPKVSSITPESIDINNTIIKIGNSEMNGSLREIEPLYVPMQSFNYMVTALRHIFKYLKMHELLSASRVCTAWNIIAMNKVLWQNVHLKKSMVFDWKSCVESINQQRTVTLDTRRMLMPLKVEEFKSFWSNFSKAMIKAETLKFIELYKCPTHVVEDIIKILPKLEVLKASSIKNSNLTKESKNEDNCMVLNLNYLGQMSNLTELRLKGLIGIKLTSLPSFENLVNLNKFSLTSVKSFPKDICQRLDTITENIEFLEIGDCNCLSKDFAVSLKRFVNLKWLRLEHCYGQWINYAQDVFTVIRGLEELNVLELINLEFSNCVKDQLEKCDGIKSLLIIPAYVSQSAAANRHVIDCLEKLSKTLTHLGWGLTSELLKVTHLFITQYQQNQHTIGYNLELSNTKETTNNIPILRTSNLRQLPGDENDKEIEKNKADNVDILSVPDLEKLLDTTMPDTKTRIIIVPLSGIFRVYLNELFNDL